MSTQRKPSIVFVHGLWADGSCFSKLIPTLLAEGHEVIAAQHGLDSHAEDIANVRRTLKRATNDHTIQPELQRFVAKRMGAKTFETNSSHVPMLSQAHFVLDVIRRAASAL
jgi:hypothetical protein